MTTLELTRVDPADFAARRDAIATLNATVRAIDGHDSLGESIWRDLGDPGPDSVGFLIEGRAYIHVTRSEGAGAAPHFTAGVVRAPNARDRATTAMLLGAAIAHVAGRGGGRLECWVFGAAEADDAAFSPSGFVVARELFEMRAALPVAGDPVWPAGVSVREFVPGHDDADWLRVNNCAFAGHPDQGGWTESVLRHRFEQSWFDPTLFLLAVDGAGIAGFNWLKLHEPEPPDPALGEIYVIGVDPRAQGTGLGRALARAGLHAVHARNVTLAMLFCAADNDGALALYRSLGFAVHRTDRAYMREVGSR